MKPSSMVLAVIVAAVVLAFGACVGTPSQRPAEDVLYVNLMWHQHQPLYFQDPDTGVYSRPWVRVHATKSYYDMAAILRDYPDVRATFNLTPVLLRQLNDFIDGAKDIYWVLALKHPSELSPEEKQFILERFFDANHTNMIGKFPRYTELLRRKEQIDTRTAEGIAAFSEQDYMDLQVFFNLVWFDPDFLAKPPLADLVARGGDFRQEDKAALFAKAHDVMTRVVPIHRELQDARQIEVTTTPYAHPILPLIFSTNIASRNDPTAELPNEFYFPNDAVAHLERSVEIYRDTFGRDPVGLWPAEGAVAQEIVKMVGDAGYRWMASGEHVLARSLGIDGFGRDSRDVVIDADALYRPYIVQPARGEPVAIVFRDLRLSDLIGFEYSGTPGEAAAADLMRRLEEIRQRLKTQPGAEGPHLVSIILDGENAWEHYPNDGKEFLHALYRNLSETPTIRTITVSEFIDRYPDQRRIERLWPGSWFSPDFATWIGEPEETRAWNLLGEVRNHLALYDMRNRRTTTPERLERALDSMYLAQGSDWFWWFGDDQDSGQDEYFDEAFRELLKNVYRALGDPIPVSLSVPIIPERPAPPDRRPTALFTPVIDGVRDDAWENAGYYRNVGGVQARAADVLSTVSYGFDTESFHMLVESSVPLQQALTQGAVHVYIGYPGQIAGRPFADAPGNRLIGFDAALYLDISRSGVELRRAARDGTWATDSTRIPAGFADRAVELSVPLSAFGDLEAGDELSFVALVVEPAGVVDAVPTGGSGRTNLPELGGGVPILIVDDPVGDDRGPGTYVYPTDRVFAPGVFDMQRFIVEREERYLKFTIDLVGPIQNHWGSGINLSLQTIDIYIDTDPGAATGARMLLEGRNAALPPDYGWEYALWIEGWHQRILVPADRSDPASPPVELPGSPLRVRVDADAGRVIVRMPIELLPAESDPADFGYTAVVLSQEGFPSAGVRRVRNVAERPAQWTLGGARPGINNTRIIDMAVPADAGVTQEELLSDFTPITGRPIDSLGPDDFPRAYVNTVD